jgi:hypothetical protein
MEGLDSIARRYGRLPSEVIRVRNPMKALSIDIWAHSWGVQREAQEARKVRERLRHGR